MDAVQHSVFIGALVSLLLIIFIIGGGVILLYLHFQKNLVTQRLRQETLKNIHQGELLGTTIRAQEEERRRIAQDLHDELGAVLSMIRMNLVMMEQHHDGTDADLTLRLRNVRELSETALSSVRAISHRLMPPQLAAFGLIQTLESVGSKIHASGQLQIRLTVSEAVPELSWDQSIGLYRIIMELINNTIRHSGACRVHIRFSRQDGRIVCRYTDDGCGIDPGALKRGMGYASIEARVNALQGRFEEGLPPGGRGYSAAVYIPVDTGTIADRTGQ